MPPGWCSACGQLCVPPAPRLRLPVQAAGEACVCQGREEMCICVAVKQWASFVFSS